MHKINVLITMFSILNFFGVAYAEDWVLKAGLAGLVGVYSGTTDKKSIYGGTGSLSADYLELGGIKVVGSTLTIDTGSGYPIYQKTLFSSVNYNQYCDTLGGVIKMRLDVHQINLNNDLSYQDDAKVYAPQLAYLNYAKTFYVDMGYALSGYKNGLNVQQITPTVGFAFNNASDWLQTRVYLISTSDAVLAQGTGKSQAVEMKYTHWAAPASIFKQLFINVLIGERVFAVDGDAASVYSLPDVQQGAGSIGASWKDRSWSGSLLVGVDSYLNNITKNRYLSSYVYLNVSKSW